MKPWESVIRKIRECDVRRWTREEFGRRRVLCFANRGGDG